MPHLKRQGIGKFWPIKRKGTAYLAVATHNKTESMPLVVVLRDVLKLVRNKKELQRLLNEKQVLINQKEIRETNYPIGLFDKISLINAKKYYAVKLSEHKKMAFEEISEKDTQIKTYRVMDKKVLRGKKIQLNLGQGKNILSDEKMNIGDSVVINLKDNKIKKVIPMEKGKNAYVIHGKHAGINGNIEDIIERGGKKLARILKNKEKINVWIKNIIMAE